jgi:hypothetical protein
MPGAAQDARDELVLKNKKKVKKKTKKKPQLFSMFNNVWSTTKSQKLFHTFLLFWFSIEKRAIIKTVVS